MKRKNKFNPNLPRSMSKAKKALDEVHIENSAPGNALRSALAIFFSSLRVLAFPPLEWCQRFVVEVIDAQITQLGSPTRDSHLIHSSL